MCLAHRGFSWIEVETLGVAAHGSRFDLGIDANMRMGRFLARLDKLEQEVRARPRHPLVGPPSLHAAVIKGGTGTSTYADYCRLEMERRTVPGETEAQVLSEIRALTDALAEHGLGLLLDVVPNHRAAHRFDEPWWSLLQHGRSSPDAHWFDVDWDAPHAGGRVVVPMLTDTPEALLARGDKAAARKLAAELLAREPTSPHARRLQTIAKEP